jgi:broad specificity phosphatase PhoE
MVDQVIHLFRHAEAAHNQERDGSIRDPLLTAKGMKQAKKILKNYQFLNHPSLILTSPLRRTIQTVLQAFHPSFNGLAAKSFPTCPRIIALPHLQECSELLCDTGLSLAFLKSEYGQYIEFPDEFFHSEDWFIKEGTWLAANHI